MTGTTAPVQGAPHPHPLPTRGRGGSVLRPSAALGAADDGAPDNTGAALTRAALEARLRQVGTERYHDKHPFHHRLHGGQCTMDEVQAWVVNRWYYQSRIPMKDAAFLSRCTDPDLRRIWRSRIDDHDGGVEEGGGIRRWLKLAEGVGLDPAYVASGVGVMPATRFAVDAYVRFVRDEPLVAAMASSLTEMFAPAIHTRRIEGLLEHYAFANPQTIAYFRHRLGEAPKDVAFTLGWVLDHAVSRADQEAAIAALTFKTEVLWTQLDALWHGYVEGHIPPGAWRPGEGRL